MTFKEWLFSSYDNPHIDGQWGVGHIVTLVLCIGIIVTLALIFSKRSEKARRIVLFVLVGIILFFEITRRVVNFIKMTDPTFSSVMGTLLPRPWCAIACWTLILGAVINKKSFYNFGSMTALLCAIIFFSYPGVGFNNKYMLFENIYSIVTHALLLITSITLMTLHFTKFEYKTIWKESIYYVGLIVYSLLEIYVLKIEADPLYYMPGNDVMDILGLPYWAYLLVYIVFSLVYFNIFYLIGDRKTVFKKRAKVLKN